MKANGSAPCDGRIGVLLAIFDFPLLAAGYRAVIDAEPDMWVVDEIAGLDALRTRLPEPSAKVLIVETVPSGDGCGVPFRAIESLKAADPSLRVIALDSQCSGDMFSIALRSGADGFLDRSARRTDVVTAVRSVSGGRAYVIPALVTRMIDTYVLRTDETSADDVYDSLGEQDREVLRLAAVGHTNREIARTLHVSERTVHSRRAAVMEKLGFHHRVELLRYAIRRGVVEVADL